MDMIWQILLAFGVPSTIFTTIISLLIKKQEKREKEREEREKEREEREKKRERQEREREERRHKLELLQIEGTLASIALGEATATALKNGHANGETEAALSYAKTKKHEMNDFLREQGVNSIE